ncbi:hypothetical protein AAZV13_06G212900 [Glycine max]
MKARKFLTMVFQHQKWQKLGLKNLQVLNFVLELDCKTVVDNIKSTISTFVTCNCFRAHFNKCPLNFSSSCVQGLGHKCSALKKTWDRKWLLGLKIIMNVIGMIAKKIIVSALSTKMEK